MTYIKRATQAVTTDADGAATVYTEQLEGLLQRIGFVLPGAGGLESTTDVTITEEDTGVTLLTRTDVGASFTAYPRAPTSDPAGAASLFASGGEPVETPFPILGRIKIVIAQGGNAKAGTFIFDLA